MQSTTNSTDIINELLSKKVKLDLSTITFNEILEKFESLGIHTKFLYKVTTPHSLFFINKHETSFLPSNNVADKTYDEMNQYETLDFNDFLKIIGLNKNIITSEDLADFVVKSSPGTSNFFHFNTSDGIYSFRKNEIFRYLYNDNKLSIYLNNSDEAVFQLNEEGYSRFRNEML